MTAIERAHGPDRTAIESIVAANGLPLDGVQIALHTAVVARGEGGVVGCAAFEPYGSVGLLRSVCVVAHLRGMGLGRKLVGATEQLAAAAGISELFLLTETAEEWFTGLGYVPAARASVPALVMASPEFTSACPDSAAVLHKRL